MHRKQFLLLSLLVCTLTPHTDVQASSSKLSTAALTLAGLSAGAYASTILIIGTLNKNRPVLENEGSLPTDLRARREYQRQQPYQAAFEEMNNGIREDITFMGKTIKRTAENAYSLLAAAAHKAYEKAQGIDSDTAATDDNDTKNNS